MNAKKISREGLIEKQGNSGNSGNSAGDVPPEVAACLAAPPEWLTIQLAQLQEDPDRLLNPTCASIAQAVYSTATRWREVEPALTWWLGETSR